MTGALLLHGDPTSSTEAATKAYVDTATGTAVAAATTAGTAATAASASATAASTSSATAVTAAGTANTNATAAQTTANAALPKAGGTMTGAIVLAADPTLALHPTTKQYVDAAVSGSTGAALPKAGGTMTGAIVLAANPTAALNPATKSYTDAGDATNASAAATANSTASAAQTTANAALPVAGGTMTGALVLHADPTVALHPVTKQYADTADAANATAAASAQTTATSAGSTATTANTTASAALPRAGGTMTGALVLAADPTAALHPATKQYADTMLPKVGGTMTGAVVLSGAPTSGLHPATKTYTDTADAANAAAAATALSTATAAGTTASGAATTAGTASTAASAAQTTATAALPKAGGTMTGALVLAADPTSALHPATKQYVDTANATVTTTANTAVSTAATANTTANGAATTAAAAVVTANAASTNATSAQAAASSAVADASSAVTTANAALPKAGGTLTGPLVLSSAPTIGLHPATKTYTDAADASNLAVATAALPKAGGTMTGALVLAADPTSALHPATKQYTDAAIVTVQSIPHIAAASATNLTARATVQIDRWVSGSLYAPARYQQVSSDPGTGAAFQDSAGNWFANIEPVVTPEMFGAMGRGPTYAGPNYDDPAWQIAINVQRPIKAMSPTYRFNVAPIVPSHGMLWIENGLSGIQPIIYGTSAHSFAFGYVDFVHRVYIKDLCIDGGRARGTFPYSNNAPDPYTFVAFIDFHADQADTTSRADIIDCTFQNTHVYSWHLTWFQRVNDIGNHYIRTADHGCIACNVVVTDRIFKEFCSDNGVSISRGCQSAIVTNSTFKDCELAGVWFAGFNTTGSGTLTISGTYTTLGSVTVVASGASFDPSVVNTFITAVGVSDSKTCILKITAYNSPTSVTARVIIGDPSAPSAGVPTSLQATPSASWQNAPSLGVSKFVGTDNIIIGAYANGIDGVTGPKHANISGGMILRTGVVADSEVGGLASIVAGATTMNAPTGMGAKFPVNSWVIFDPPSSYQDYFIAKVTSQTGDALTIDRAAPQTYALENFRLAHRNPTFGIPINITGSSVGEHIYAEDIHIHDITINDFVGIGVRLGNTGNGSVRRVSLDNLKFFQPGLIGDTTINNPLILLQEYPGTVSDNIFITNIKTDTTTAFIKFSQRGPTARKVVLSPNFAPAASNYFTALDLDNSNADVTAFYTSDTPAKLQVQPVDPTGTVVTSGGAMMGLAVSGASPAPTVLVAKRSGVFAVSITGNAFNTTVGNGVLLHGRYSFAVAAPANGHAVIGTVFTSNGEAVTQTVAPRQAFCLTGYVGLDPSAGPVPVGTSVWIDLVLTSVGGTLASATDVQVGAVELYA